MKTGTVSRVADAPVLSLAEVITQQVQALRFGVVQIIVHDSKVVQIERTEKIRISESPATVGKSQNI